MNGFAPAAFSSSSTAATMLLMRVMPRLPTATAICAPGCNRDRTFCALNSCWTTAGISSGGDTGNFCRTANMRGNGMGVLIFQRSFDFIRSEEHTSELQSLAYLVCRLLLEKKKRRQSHLP